MKKLVMLIIILCINFLINAQDYPKIETDSNGHKIVVFTIEQAHKIDNDYDVLALLKQFRIKCDSLDLSYIKVIDEQSKQIIMQKDIINELEKEICDKDQQLEDICEINSNLEKDIKLDDDQKQNDQKEIDGLKKDVSKSKWGYFLVGAGSGALLLGAILLFL